MASEEGGDKMSLYENLSNVDILAPIQGKFKVDFDKDGNPKIYLRPMLELNSPWISTIKNPDRACDLWRTYFFNYSLIPQGCRNCFKVVMVVPTLKELFKVLEYQRKHEDNSKCGLEKRVYTGKLGLYGAYWYTPMSEGLEGARKLWKRLSNDFPSNEVILKKGCTEFENAFPPSDMWNDFAEKLQWDLKEALLDTLFEPDPMVLKIEMNTPKMLEVHIMRSWIEWAFEHNDKTYLNYVDKPFKQELMTYHKSIHNNKDYTCSNYERVQERVKYDTSNGSGQQSERKASLIQGLPES
jgi:hypothetical protein